MRIVKPGKVLCKTHQWTETYEVWLLEREKAMKKYKKLMT